MLANILSHQTHAQNGARVGHRHTGRWGAVVRIDRQTSVVDKPNAFDHAFSRVASGIALALRGVMTRPRLHHSLIAALALALPALTGAQGDGCAANSRSPAPDVAGSWDITYDDMLDVEIRIGGAVYNEVLVSSGWDDHHQSRRPRSGLQSRLPPPRGGLPERGMAEPGGGRAAQQPVRAPNDRDPARLRSARATWSRRIQPSAVRGPTTPIANGFATAPSRSPSKSVSG